MFPFASGVRRRHSPVSAGRRIHVWETNGNMIDQPLQLQRRTVKFEFGTRFQYDVVGQVPAGTAAFVVSSAAVILGVDINHDETAHPARLAAILSVDSNVRLEIVPDPSAGGRWAIQRTDATRPMFLSSRGTWTTIATAVLFAGESEAWSHADSGCPAGTTGSPVQVGFQSWTERPT